MRVEGREEEETGQTERSGSRESRGFQRSARARVARETRITLAGRLHPSVERGTTMSAKRDGELSDRHGDRQSRLVNDSLD